MTDSKAVEAGNGRNSSGVMKEMQRYGLAIIGGGAAGMMAALSASRIMPGRKIVLLEKNPVLGRKVSATGNGRCNFSNRLSKWSDYRGGGTDMVRHAFDCLSPQATVNLFEELGVLAREESDGRLYPYSEQGSCVAEALRDALRIQGVDIRPDTTVSSVKKVDGIFVVETDPRLIGAEKLIIATGGKAGHKFGSTGDGYGFAKSFGHSLIRPLPALVQIVSDERFSEKLKGVRVKGLAILAKGEDIIAQEAGEIQFTGDGLSGICIFDLSRYLGEKPEEYHVRIDLFPNYSQSEMLNMMKARKASLGGRRAEALLKGMLNEKLIPLYLGLSKIKGDSPIEEVEESKIRDLAGQLKDRRIGVKGTKGWIEAQVTSGGINSKEINAACLESKLVAGLFFAGEILDIDGKCGGWNLQWAWSSGWAAGLHAAGISTDYLTMPLTQGSF